jgi:cell division protein FtsW
MPGERRRKSPLRPAKRPRGKVRSARPVEYNLLLTATLALLAFGAVMVFSASSTTRILSDGGLADSAFYLQRTLIAVVIGLVVMWAVMRVRLERIRKATPMFLGLTLFLLAAVLVAGTAVNGTKGWFVFGPVQIQPAEFLKLALVVYGAYLFAGRPDRLHSIREMGPYLLFTAASCLLMMAQPDMGTAMVAVFAAGITLYAAGARIRDLVLIGGVIGVAAMALAVAAPYRRQRLLTFLDPGGDVTGAGFQTTQAKIAIGSGGIDGVGIGNGVQKASYLPEAHTDMISAVIGEEFGLIGMVLLLVGFGAFGYAGLRIARMAKDDYGRILAAGLTGLIIVQACLNLYAVMGWAPLTGVPLPLVSYGNNSMLVTLIAVGLMLNVARGGTAGTARLSRSGRAPGGAARLRLVEGTPGKPRDGRTREHGHGRDGGRRHGGARGARRGGRRRAL